MPQNKQIYRTASPSERQILNNIWNHYVGKNEHSQNIYDALIERYDEQHRAYHNVGHLVELFEYFYKHKDNFKDPRTVALALFYHDIIYDVSHKDNEARSALMVLKDLPALGFNVNFCERVANLVTMTASHICDENDMDAALMLDMDMAVLGLPNPDYKRYARAIEKEYKSYYPTTFYQQGRIQFLNIYRKKERFFMTDIFENRYGAEALANIKAEYRALQARTKETSLKP